MTPNDPLYFDPVNGRRHSKAPQSSAWKIISMYFIGIIAGGLLLPLALVAYVRQGGDPGGPLFLPIAVVATSFIGAVMGVIFVAIPHFCASWSRRNRRHPR